MEMQSNAPITVVYNSNWMHPLEFIYIVVLAKIKNVLFYFYKYHEEAGKLNYQVKNTLLRLLKVTIKWYS